MKVPLFILSLFLLSFQCKQTKVEGRAVNRIKVEQFQQEKVPLFINRDNNDLVVIKLHIAEGQEPLKLEKIEIRFSEGLMHEGISSVSVKHAQEESAGQFFNKGTASIRKNKVTLQLKQELSAGTHFLHLGVNLKDNADLLTRFNIENVRLHFAGRDIMDLSPENPFTYRVARVLRAEGEDNCHTYRIPGIITTSAGTLIAVYDNRYNNSKDLQEDIDVGMSRSTDGGQTWEPMRVIMDMGEWGGRPERLNGIGDPAVLYDHFTGTIWVAGLWMSGATENDMLWWASKPGMSPEETGQFILVKSTDDGITWSEPFNITEQIKDPSWQLLLQGPGRGITLDDGTLVFPAQFKADIGEKAIDGGQYTCHSTIVFSRDGGNTWEIGTGAKPNTTEAQVVQLAGGDLMLNMRDDLNRIVRDESNGRAVAVTADLGKTWTIHPSSNSALPEPNCMASIIAAVVNTNNGKQQVLFFSNPDNRETRTNMTIKTSFDGGHTWPPENQVELYGPAGYGYSCMTMVDDNHIGIVYEGMRELYFQKVPVADLLGNMMNK